MDCIEMNDYNYYPFNNADLLCSKFSKALGKRRRAESNLGFLITINLAEPNKLKKLKSNKQTEFWNGEIPLNFLKQGDLVTDIWSKILDIEMGKRVIAIINAYRIHQSKLPRNRLCYDMHFGGSILTSKMAMTMLMSVNCQTWKIQEVWILGKQHSNSSIRISKRCL